MIRDGEHFGWPLPPTSNHEAAARFGDPDEFMRSRFGEMRKSKPTIGGTIAAICKAVAIGCMFIPLFGLIYVALKVLLAVWLQ